MACNKPIVASNVGGISNIIEDNKNGLLCNKNDYKDLSEKILTLIEDNEKSKKFVEYNKNNRNKYDIKELIKKHQELLEEE